MGAVRYVREMKSSMAARFRCEKAYCEKRCCKSGRLIAFSSILSGLICGTAIPHGREAALPRSSKDIWPPILHRRSQHCFKNCTLPPQGVMRVERLRNGSWMRRQVCLELALGTTDLTQTFGNLGRGGYIHIICNLRYLPTSTLPYPLEYLQCPYLYLSNTHEPIDNIVFAFTWPMFDQSLCSTACLGLDLCVTRSWKRGRKTCTVKVGSALLLVRLL